MITDWTDAYTNGAYISGAEAFPAAWAEAARLFRGKLEAEGRAKLDIIYGEGRRNRLDLFLPEGEPKGLVVFIHGGYWLNFDKSYWSHLATGALARGFAVALPSYTLCPEIRIAGISAEVGQAITTAAGMVQGPIHLTGHSAGGHLATRMITTTSPLPDTVRARVVNVVSISGVHDLRPLMRAEMNARLKLDTAEAFTESPALLEPWPGARVTAWVGADERPEFLRQSALLANIWTGLGAETANVEEPDKHHFSIVDGLTEPDHPLVERLLTA